jgi:hypothetical protein
MSAAGNIKVRRRTAVTILAASLLVASQSAMVPAPDRTEPGTHSASGSHRMPTPVLPAAPPRVAIPPALPKMSGSVPVRPQVAAAAPATAKFALRALVIATDTTDFGRDTWKTTLDRVGAPYDILYARNTPLTRNSLVRPDGTGRYGAILLTTSGLEVQDAAGTFASALSNDEWNLLWAYERDYGVRQATLYTSYGTFPEDYCLRAGSETAVGTTPLNTTLTATGAAVFSYLNRTARIPITQSYVYRDTLAAGCAAQPVLTAGNSVLGVQTTSTDGRERLALTVTSNQYLLHANLLVYGMFRWASRGLFLGEQRHSLNVDADDWFSPIEELLPNGTYRTFQLSAHDAYNASTWQTAVRERYPLADEFTLAVPYNGRDVKLNAPAICYPDGGPAQLTETSRCLRANFRWINHSMTHAKMNFSDFDTNMNEIGQNLAVANMLELPIDRTILKTPEFSGLGVYHPDPNNNVDPPTDHGLAASNREMLRAAKTMRLKYLHGNMSFPSQVPGCFNCGIVHPLETSLTVVPDWPTNIAYFSTDPAEETYFYNLYYGPNGKFPAWPRNLTYDEIINVETDIALTHLATGSVYAHTFHVTNLRDYAGGRTLLTDWADALIAKYVSYYSVPLLSLSWTSIAAYATGRNAHFAALTAGVDAVYDRARNRVTVTSPAAGTVTVSGVQATGFTDYGDETSGTVTLAANTPVALQPDLLP